MEKNYPLKLTTRKGGKQIIKNCKPKAKKLLICKPVPSPYCVKTVRQKPWDNIPQPNPKANSEAKPATKQPLLQKPTKKLEVDMPSEKQERELHHHQGAASQDQMAVAPPHPDIDDAAINAEMVKLQITLESETTERLKRVEARRKQDEETKVTLKSEK